MPAGDPGGNFAGTGGYGGQFPGYGGASAGYTGGYGNPSSVGGGTAGQTYASRPYANTLNKYNPSRPNYSGSGTTGGGWHYGGATSSTTTRVPQSPILGPLDTAPVPVPAPAPAPTTTTTTTRPRPAIVGPVGRYGYGGYPNPSQFNGSEYPDWVGGSWQNVTDVNPPGGLGTQGRGYPGFGGGNTHVGFGEGDPPTPGSTGSGKGAGRQFGGPVGPGQQYTVGENGPETLQMGAQGGQVIPNNPVDRLGGMNPGMMQALFQLMQQRGGQRPGMNPGQAPVGQPAPMPQPPQMRPPVGQVPGGQGGGFRLGDWRNRMGIEGLSRPARQPGMGFGGSGLGMPGIMPQMQQRPGFGG